MNWPTILLCFGELAAGTLSKLISSASVAGVGELIVATSCRLDSTTNSSVNRENLSSSWQLSKDQIGNPSIISTATSNVGWLALVSSRDSLRKETEGNGSLWVCYKKVVPFKLVKFDTIGMPLFLPTVKDLFLNKQNVPSPSEVEYLRGLVIFLVGLSGLILLLLKLLGGSISAALISF